MIKQEYTLTQGVDPKTYLRSLIESAKGTYVSAGGTAQNARPGQEAKVTVTYGDTYEAYNRKVAANLGIGNLPVGAISSTSVQKPEDLKALAEQANQLQANRAKQNEANTMAVGIGQARSANSAKNAEQATFPNQQQPSIFGTTSFNALA
jgi:hypothetical protein